MNRRWVSLGVAVCLVTAVSIWLFPWGASAFYVERAGRELRGSPVRSYEVVKKLLRQALRWDADNAQAYRLLARACEAQGDRSGMIHALAQYVALRPRDPLEHWRLAVACEQLSPADLATMAAQPCGFDEVSRQAAVIELWRRAGQTAPGFVRDADRLREEGRSLEATSFYRRALLLDPDSVTAWHGLALALRELPRDPGTAPGPSGGWSPQEELEAWGQVIRLGDDAGLVAAAHGRRGEILAGAGRWEEARVELAAAVALAPKKGAYHLDYGWVLAQQEAGGSQDEARAELELAATLMPDNPWPSLRLAMVAFAAGDYAVTVERASQAIDIQPDLFWGWVWKGHGLTGVGRLSEAEAAHRRALMLAPEQAAPYGGLGRALFKQGRALEAVSAYERAVSLAPGVSAYRLGLAEAYRSAGKIDEAVEVYRRLLEVEPDNSAARNALRELGE